MLEQLTNLGFVEEASASTLACHEADGKKPAPRGGCACCPLAGKCGAGVGRIWSLTSKGRTVARAYIDAMGGLHSPSAPHRPRRLLAAPLESPERLAEGNKNARREAFISDVAATLHPEAQYLWIAAITEETASTRTYRLVPDAERGAKGLLSSARVTIPEPQGEYRRGEDTSALFHHVGSLRRRVGGLRHHEKTRSGRLIYPVAPEDTGSNSLIVKYSQLIPYIYWAAAEMGDTEAVAACKEALGRAVGYKKEGGAIRWNASCESGTSIFLSSIMRRDSRRDTVAKARAGVDEVSVNLVMERATVTYDPATLGPGDLVKKVVHTAEVADKSAGEEDLLDSRRRSWRAKPSSSSPPSSSSASGWGRRASISSPRVSS